MKKIFIPIIFLTLIAGCEKENPNPEPKKNIIEDPLIFNDLLELMGMDTSNIKNFIPGKLYKEEIDLGELQLWYLMMPENLAISDSLLFLYEFMDNKLNKISFLVMGLDQLNYNYIVMNCALNQLDEADEYFISYESDHEDLYEFPITFKELWDFIKSENLYPEIINGIGAIWYYNEWKLSIGYLGDYM